MTQVLTYVEVDVPRFDEGVGTQTFRFALPTSYLPREIPAIASISRGR